MNNYPVFINLTLYSAFYDIMYFYIATYNFLMASNNSDTARYGVCPLGKYHFSKLFTVNAIYTI